MKFNEKQRASYEKTRQFYYKLNQRSGGILGIIRHATNQFTKANGSESAASMSYYALFSLFPLLLVLISVTGFFLKREVAQAKVLEVITAALPIAENVLAANLDVVLQLRGPIGIFALVTLIWSSTTVFNRVVLNVNRAFPEGRTPNFLHSRLLALIIIFTLSLLFILSIAATTITEIIPAFTIPINGRNLHETALWRVISILGPFVIKFLLFWGLYQWIPRTSVRSKAALISALTIAIVWELVTNGFTWVISKGIVNYKLVYGSLSAFIALMFWIYLTGVITIYGAHLTHAIDYHLRAIEKTGSEVEPELND